MGIETGRRRAAGVFSGAVALLAVLVLASFLLYGRFTPGASLLHGGAFFALILLSLLRNAFASHGKDDVREELDRIMQGDKLDLRPSGTGRQSAISRYTSQIREHFVSMAKNMQSITCSFYLLERQLKGFFKSLDLMSAEIGKGVDSSVKIHEGVETQLAACEEISATAQTLANLAGEMNASVVAVGQGAERGSDRLVEMEQLFTRLGSNAAELNEQTQTLSAKTNTIRAVAASITDIADQTNLLALNASIEAARAGTAGRGFAVVAEEVKALADESKRSASQIFASLEDMTTCVRDTAASVNAMSSSMSEVNEAVHIILSEIGTVLKEVSLLGNSSKTVAHSSEELGASAEEMTSSAELVANETTVMRRIYESIEGRLSELGDLAHTLKNTAQSGSAEASGMISDLKTIKSMTEGDFADSAENAIKAHREWISALKKSMDTGKMHLETDGSRCKFGVFLSSIERPDAISDSTWKDMLSMHGKLHKFGHAMEDALERNDMKSAEAIYKEAATLSSSLVETLSGLIRVCNNC